MIKPWIKAHHEKQNLYTTKNNYQLNTKSTNKMNSVTNTPPKAPKGQNKTKINTKRTKHLQKRQNWHGTSKNTKGKLTKKRNQTTQKNLKAHSVYTFLHKQETWSNLSQVVHKCEQFWLFGRHPPCLWSLSHMKGAEYLYISHIWKGHSILENHSMVRTTEYFLKRTLKFLSKKLFV